MTPVGPAADRPPLTARSVAASTLLGVEPPRLPVSVLVRTGELFGIAAGTMRTALSRMAARGEVEVQDGEYELVGRLRARQERQAAGRRGHTRPWDGTWELVVVTAESRTAAERSELRSAMATLQQAELREGVWCRPDNLDPRRAADARAVRDDQCVLVTAARSAGLRAGELWDLSGWARGARRLRAEVHELVPRLEGRDPSALAPGFVCSAAVLRHFLRDPLLPPELLPPDWPGTALRSDYDTFDAAFRRTHVDWIDRINTIRT